MFAVIIFSACSQKGDTQNYKVFHYNQINPISSLDPAFSKSQNNIWATRHLFDGLVQLDEELNVIPAIAKDWSISEDGRSYLFNLRNDVYFHDNPCFNNMARRVVAEDFKFSLSRIIDSDVNSPGSWLFNGKIDDSDPFVVINDSTFQINLKDPFRPFLGILTMQYCSVVPHEAVRYYGKQFMSNPVGTGPFYFKKWIENQALFLLRNEKYYEGPSQLEGVRTSFITDRKIAFLELLNGNIEYTSGLESSFINELLKSDGSLQEDKEELINYKKSPFLNSEYLGINMDMSSESSLSNKKVRQALNYAIDRELMLEVLRNNVGQPATSGFIPVGLPSHGKGKVQGYNYNLTKARLLLAEAGYPDGKGIQPITIFTNQDYVDITTFVAKEWEKIGVPTDIELMESAVLRAGMRKASIPLFRASWIADYPDGESFLCMFYSKNPAPPNYTRFSNSRFDELYEAALKETEDEKRFELYWKMEEILVDEAPVIFLFYDETAVFTTKNISGLSKNALNLLEVKQLQHY